MFYHAAPQHSMRVKNHTDPRVDTYGNVFEVALALDLDNDEFLVECLKAEGELGGITKALNIDCHTIQLPLDDDGAFRKAALQALVHTVGTSTLNGSRPNSNKGIVAA